MTETQRKEQNRIVFVIGKGLRQTMFLVVVLLCLLAVFAFWLFPLRRGVTAFFVVRPNNYPVLDGVMYFFATPNPYSHALYSNDPTGPWRIHMWASGAMSTNRYFVVNHARLTTVEGAVLNLVTGKQPTTHFVTPAFQKPGDADHLG